MNTTRHFPAAPWSTSLKIISAFATIMVICVAMGAYRVNPPTGFAHRFGSIVPLVVPAMLVLSLFFTVTGYVVSPNELQVQRLLWATRIPFEGLQRAWADPSACKGSLRIFGNGGLFSFTGLYQNSRLGRFRLFATNFAHTVVLSFPDRSVVITPAASDLFVEHIHHIFPATQKQG